MTQESLQLITMEFLDFFAKFILVYFVVLNGTYLVMTLAAFRKLRRYSREVKAAEVREFIETIGALPITVITPAYNEERDAVDVVNSLLGVDYPQLEVVFVNDGSTDTTLARMKAQFELHPAHLAPVGQIETKPIRGIYRSRKDPRLWLIDKENGGKGDALNAGLNVCRSPIFCTIDADTLLEKDALLHAVRPFLLDRRTVAAGAVIRIVNGCEARNNVVTRVALPSSHLARFQVVEYMRSFLTSRVGWSTLNANLIISGAFALFSRHHVMAAGGYSTTTVTEDMELVVRLHRMLRETGESYRIAFVPDTVAWTECPESPSELARQRHRWQRGLMESMAIHRVMLFNPRYGAVGAFAFPFYYLFELLGPVIEFCGYLLFLLLLVFGRLTAEYAVAFLVLAVLLGSALSMAAVALEELTFRRYPGWKNLFLMLAYAFLENIGFRQFMTVSRVKGLIDVVRHTGRWGKVSRKGFAAAPSEISSVEARS